MIAKILALAGGISGAVALSQYPEFSQQYIQRLGGQVDALTLVVADFDRSATANGLTRDAALDQLQGTAFLAARKTDTARMFARHERLAADLAFLRLASPMERIAMPHRLGDAETFAATWGDYQPALPLTVAGAVAGVLGFFGGFAGIKLVFSILGWPFRRLRAKSPVRDAAHGRVH
ncbi:Protein of unknown function [Pseudorhodobacter antarcticus]|jgi:hypothetical protein|uniref:DUF2937 family protein n=1 Tax=Pseudorhodobacter antarcticus TaxID=1077947 RepID=A0A1H8I4U9_9RHOB|nr:DUF2937 family protein [Pseudorhodobacter antarcticus]SEN63217.1 Protein of unknown function [Pseudorhodobacter antarcticus]